MNLNILVKHNENYFREIFGIALPIIIQNLVFQLQTLVNRAFLGNVKSEYLSVIGNTSFPYQATLSILIAISTGLTIIVSRAFGASDKARSEILVNSSMLFNSAFSLILFFIWFFCSNYIFELMNVDKSLIGLCNQYIHIMCIYLIFMGVDITLQASLQGIGKTRPIMFTGIYKVVVNIFLDWCLIFGNVGFPKMGILGAAIASSFSNVSASLILFIYVYFFNRKNIAIDFQKLLHPSWQTYKEVMSLGLPTGFENFAWQIGNLILIRLLNCFDEKAVGMYTIITTIEFIAYLLFDGMSRGMLTLVGFRLGNNDFDGAKSIVKSCIIYDLILATSIISIFIIFSKNILCIFSSDTALILNSIIYFYIICAALFPKSLNVVVGSGIRAFGDTKWMLYSQIIGTILVISLSYILIYAFKINIIAIYITLLVDETFRAILNSFRYYKGKNPLSFQKVD